MRTRDYKHVGAAGRPAQRAPSGRGFGFPTGIVLGIALGAATMHFYHAMYRVPAGEPPATAPAPAQSAASDGVKPDDYEFFEILPVVEVEVPEPEEVDVQPPSIYDVQVASFRTQEQAEVALKKLAAMELEAEMQVVEGGDGETWYLLRLGPYDRVPRVNNVRMRLIKEGFSPLVKKR